MKSRRGRATTTAHPGPRVVLPGGEENFDFGGRGVRWKIDAVETGGGFSVVHHPIAARALAAPLHRRRNEDECSHDLEMDFESVPAPCDRFGLTFPKL